MPKERPGFYRSVARHAAHSAASLHHEDTLSRCKMILSRLRKPRRNALRFRGNVAEIYCGAGLLAASLYDTAVRFINLLQNFWRSARQA